MSLHNELRETPVVSSSEAPLRTWRDWGFSHRNGEKTWFSQTVITPQKKRLLQEKSVDFSTITLTPQTRSLLELWFELKMGFVAQPQDLQHLIDEVAVAGLDGYALPSLMAFFAEATDGQPEVFDETVRGTLTQQIFYLLTGSKELIKGLDRWSKLSPENCDRAARAFSESLYLAKDGFHALATKIIAQRLKRQDALTPSESASFFVDILGTKLEFTSTALRTSQEQKMALPLIQNVAERLSAVGKATGRTLNEFHLNAILTQLIHFDLSTGTQQLETVARALQAQGIAAPLELFSTVSKPQDPDVITTHHSEVDDSLNQFRNGPTQYITPRLNLPVYFGSTGHCPHPTNIPFHHR